MLCFVLLPDSRGWFAGCVCVCVLGDGDVLCFDQERGVECRRSCLLADKCKMLCVCT